MAATIVQFPHATQPVEPLAQFIRLGETSYKRTASLVSEGHLRANRIVIDASRIRFLKEHIRQFKEAGIEIVLDTKAAELAAIAKYKGVAKDSPWSDIAGGEPIGNAFFLKDHPADIYGQIARCAIEYGVDAVLTPSHFLGDKHCDHWLDADRQGCLLLRDALDREGGQHIAIDYLLITPHILINETDARLGMMNALADLPFDNLWIRASGFGNDSGAQPIVNLIRSFTQLHNLGKPIITDYLGGLVGEAAMALGSASGMCHGIIEQERFDARQWHNPPKKPKKGQPMGRARRVSLSAINKSLTVSEYETLCSATGGKRLLMPQHRINGAKTIADVADDPKILASIESVSHFKQLSEVPNTHRGEHFIKHRMEPAVELARQVKNLNPNLEVARNKKVDVESLMKRMSKHSKDMNRKSNAIDHLRVELENAGSQARPVQRLSPVEVRARGEMS